MARPTKPERLVAEYEHATLSVPFPAGEARCTTCPLYATRTTDDSRPHCWWTHELLFDGYRFGDLCPLRFDGEKPVNRFEIIGENAADE